MHTLSFFLCVFKKQIHLDLDSAVCSWEVQYVKEKQKCPFCLQLLVSCVVYEWGLSGCQALLLNYKDIGV